MTIEIHNPELERLLQQRIEAGNFADVEEMLLYALRQEEDVPAAKQPCGKSLVAFFRESPLVGLELDFERDQDSDRDIPL